MLFLNKGVRLENYFISDFDCDMDQSKPECVHKCRVMGQVTGGVVY